MAASANAIQGGAEREIDVRGQVVAPGFIDLHSHASRGTFDLPTADNYVRQGVTTLITGPDGSSSLPLGITVRGSCQGIFHAIGEDDLQRIMRHPATMIASDGDVIVFGRAHPTRAATEPSHACSRST